MHLQIIKYYLYIMDYKDIIGKIGKYHYVLVVGKKAGILSSDDSSNDAKKKAIDAIKKKGSKLDKHLVVRLKLLEISKRLLKSNEESKIKTIGGPIQIDIEFYKINDQKLEKLNDYLKNNKLFITDDFLLKKKKIGEDIIKLIASAAHNNILSNTLFVLNTIDKLVKD